MRSGSNVEEKQSPVNVNDNRPASITKKIPHSWKIANGVFYFIGSTSFAGGLTFAMLQTLMAPSVSAGAAISVGTSLLIGLTVGMGVLAFIIGGICFHSQYKKGLKERLASIEAIEKCEQENQKKLESINRTKLQIFKTLLKWKEQENQKEIDDFLQLLFDKDIEKIIPIKIKLHEIYNETQRLQRSPSEFVNNNKHNNKYNTDILSCFPEEKKPAIPPIDRNTLNSIRGWTAFIGIGGFLTSMSVAKLIFMTILGFGLGLNPFTSPFFLILGASVIVGLCIAKAYHHIQCENEKLKAGLTASKTYTEQLETTQDQLTRTIGEKLENVVENTEEKKSVPLTFRSPGPTSMRRPQRSISCPNMNSFFKAPTTADGTEIAATLPLQPVMKPEPI